MRIASKGALLLLACGVCKAADSTAIADLNKGSQRDRFQSLRCENGSTMLKSAGSCAVLMLSGTGRKKVIMNNGNSADSFLGNLCIATGGKLEHTGSQAIHGNARFERRSRFPTNIREITTGTVTFKDKHLSNEKRDAIRESNELANATCNVELTSLPGGTFDVSQYGSKKVIVCINSDLKIRKDVTLKGSTKNKIVFNINGNFMLNGAKILGENIKPRNIIFNLMNGKHFLSEGDRKSVLDGTIMAPMGKIVLSNTEVNGQLISGDRVILSSGSILNCKENAITTLDNLATPDLQQPMETATTPTHPTPPTPTSSPTESPSNWQTHTPTSPPTPQPSSSPTGSATQPLKLAPPEEAQCNIWVKKFCRVRTPPPSNFECDSPIESLTMIWDGNHPIRIKAWKGEPGNTLLLDKDNVHFGDEVTVSGFAGSPNDVYWEIFRADSSSKIGESVFGEYCGSASGISYHNVKICADSILFFFYTTEDMSCSDDSMYGPEDCGKLLGNNGKEESGLINQWRLEGLVDASSTLECGASDPPEVSECTVNLSSQALCEGLATSLVLRYVGGDCSDTNNRQDGNFECSGSTGTRGPVRIVLEEDDIMQVTPTGQTIDIGDEFTISAVKGELKPETELKIFQGGSMLESLAIDTSCSKRLALGDRFGSVQVVGIGTENNGFLRSGIDVEYTYLIQNIGVGDIKDISMVDSNIADMEGRIDSLAEDEEVILTAKHFVDDDTTSVVRVEGITVGSANVCSATASSTVTVER